MVANLVIKWVKFFFYFYGWEGKGMYINILYFVFKLVKNNRYEIFNYEFREYLDTKIKIIFKL